MIIKRISFANVGPYRGFHTIEPAQPRGGEPGITLLGGLNGAGKTTLLNLVLFILYGDQSPAVRSQLGSYSAYLESLCHRGAHQSDFWASLDLDLPSQTLRVRRSWHQAKVRWVDTLDVWHNGEHDPALAQGWASYVEELIPSDLATLFFFDGEQIGTLAERDETPRVVQTAMRRLLGISAVDRSIAVLNRVIGKHSRLAADRTPEHLEALVREHQQETLKRDSLEQELAQVASNLQRTQNLLMETEAEYFQLGGAVAGVREGLVASRDALESDVSQMTANLIHLASGPLPLLLIAPQLHHLMERASEAANQRRAASALWALEQRNLAIEEFLHQQPITQETADGMRALLNGQVSELRTQAQKSVPISLSDGAMAQISHVLGTAESLLSEATTEFGRLQAAYTELSQLERHLDVEVDHEKLGGVATRLRSLMAQLSQQESTQARLAEELGRTVRRIDDIERKMAEVSDDLAAVTEAERVVQFSIKSRETLKAFREKLLRQRVFLLEGKITRALSQLLRKNATSLTVVIDHDSFAIRLQDHLGEDLPKNQLSSGERQMLAVAILWGLSQAAGNGLPVIIDTPMGRLDSSHRHNFVSRYLPSAAPQVIVLSTDTEVTGVYLDELGPYIKQMYFIDFDDGLGASSIQEGYFAGVDSRVESL